MHHVGEHLRADLDALKDQHTCREDLLEFADFGNTECHVAFLQAK